MSKTCLLLISCVFILSGCGSAPIADNAAKGIPKSRLLAFKTNEPDTVKLTITRDSGLAGSKCYVGFSIDGKLAARFDTEETADFYLRPGVHELGIVHDPMGRGLCAILTWDSVIESISIDEHSVNRYRMGYLPWTGRRKLMLVDENSED